MNKTLPQTQLPAELRLSDDSFLRYSAYVIGAVGGALPSAITIPAMFFTTAACVGIGGCSRLSAFIGGVGLAAAAGAATYYGVLRLIRHRHEDIALLPTTRPVLKGAAVSVAAGILLGNLVGLAPTKGPEAKAPATPTAAVAPAEIER